MLYVNSRFLCQSLSGVQRFAIEISLRLKEHFGDEIVFIAPHNIVLKEYARILGVKIVGYGHTGYFWEQCDLPLYLLSKGKPLLLNLCNMSPLLYSNSIYTLHDVSFKAMPEAYNWKYKIVYGLLCPVLLKRSKHVLTVSNFSKSEICKYYNVKSDKISVVYNAVDSKFFHTNSSRYCDQLYIMTVSSIGLNKNFIMTLKIFDKLKKTLPYLKLYVIGKTLEANKHILYNKYANNPDVVFLATVTDYELRELYSNALAFVYPSIYEGFGIPPLEAQACMCPVVGAESGPLPEILGNSALCNAPYDCDALTNSVMSIYNSQEVRKNLIERGLINVNRFSWEESAKKINYIIEKYQR